MADKENNKNNKPTIGVEANETPSWWGTSFGIQAPPSIDYAGTAGQPSGMGGNIYEKYGVPNTRAGAERAFSQLPPMVEPLSTAEKLAQMEAFQSAGRAQQDQVYENRLAQTGSYFPQEVPAGPTFEDYLSGLQGFDGSPYDRASEYMLERRQAQMEAIQNMYNQYAAEAEANAARVADIYGGAQAGISETYGGAQGLTEAAYGSAQQQAADQLARLGIEAAAPAVVNPMALSQAEAVSNLIANEAAGRGAVERYGATGRDFASNMAQVAQQQAVEQQDQFTSQLADQLFELEMQRAQAEAAYDPYSQALKQLEAEQAFNQLYYPAPDTDSLQRAAELQLETTLSRQDKLLQLWSEIVTRYASDEEAMAAAEAAMQQAEANFPLR